MTPNAYREAHRPERQRRRHRPRDGRLDRTSAFLRRPYDCVQETYARLGSTVRPRPIRK